MESMAEERKDRMGRVSSVRLLLPSVFLRTLRERAVVAGEGHKSPGTIFGLPYVEAPHMPPDCFGYETEGGLQIYRLRQIVDTNRITAENEDDERSET